VLAAVLLLASGLAPSSGDVDAGVRLFEARRFAEARPLLERASAEHPEDAHAAEYLGRTLFEQDLLEDAARTLERAASLDPRSSWIHYWLGRAYGAQAIRGNLLVRARLAGKVRRAFERSEELDPTNVRARMALLEFHLRAPSFMGGSLEKARMEAEEIRRLDPLRGHRAAARIHENRKRYELAAAEYEAAARDFPARPDPYYWMEDAAVERKDWAAAFTALERLEKALPGETGALYETGRIAALSGKELDRGEAALRRYLELDHDPRADAPSLALAHLRLGEILEKRGDRRAAREEYDSATRLEPTLTEARQALSRLH
jgi:tetratricopeptide (TPR) repeat protein